MIQITEIQKDKIHLTINGVECVFMPMELFRWDRFLPVNKKVKGSALYWYVKDDVSYNQIKSAIKDFRISKIKK